MISHNIGWKQIFALCRTDLRNTLSKERTFSKLDSLGTVWVVEKNVFQKQIKRCEEVLRIFVQKKAEICIYRSVSPDANLKTEEKGYDMKGNSLKMLILYRSIQNPGFSPGYKVQHF
ncbi:hypothetical protein EK904_001524 [Melospiza melodia maxima]|nr:hypothetical protein EK904_001524 [Melospiza melodia maxima]